MFKTIFNIFFLFTCLLNQFTGFHHAEIQNEFRLGNEVMLDDYYDSLKDKQIALITNQTGILPDGTHIIDAMISKGLKVIKIFSPEHGIRGDENYSGVDKKTGIPVISLYGGKNKPSAQDLSDIDVIVYDIQDVGARFYTYTSTLYYALESARENNKQFYVCDRPSIINPDYVDGFILDPSFESFVGKIPAPVCYGMTSGELANYLSSGIFISRSPVKVIMMKGYTRKSDYDSLNIKWVKPSPNIFTSKTAVCYPATCFLEGTNVSEGRGSERPFEYFGAPWINAQALADELNSYGFAGVAFEPITFTPSGKISAYPPKFYNKLCNGIFINVTNKNRFEAVKCGAAILVSLYKLFSEFKFNKDNFIDKLAGTDKLRKLIINGSNFESVVSSWNEEVSKFNEIRSGYLLY